MIFDGKEFAKEIEARLSQKLKSGKTRVPKVVSILVGEDPASMLYTKLKKQAAESVGIEFEIIREKGEVTSEKLKQIISEIGARHDVTGVMVQLPLPASLRGRTSKCLEAIPLNKDVDGLRWEESGVVPATVKAILSILDKIAESQITNSQILKLGKYAVVGAKGAVGRPLVYFLKKRGIEVVEVEWDSPDPTSTVLEGQVVISCTGKAGLITEEMVSSQAIVIDVGSPTGEMTNEVYQKAAVAVAAPRGVGPVTIACLLQNAVEMGLSS